MAATAFAGSNAEGWPASVYTDPTSLLNTFSPKVPLPLPSVYHLIGDSPRPYNDADADDVLRFSVATTRRSFGEGARRYTYCDCFRVVEPKRKPVGASGASQEAKQVFCLLPNCLASSRIVALSGSDMSNAYEHVAKHHWSFVAYDDVDAMARFRPDNKKPAASSSAASTQASSASVPAARGGQSLIPMVTVYSPNKRRELQQELGARMKAFFTELIIYGNHPFNIVENEGVRSSMRLLLGGDFIAHLSDDDIPTISRRTVVRAVDQKLAVLQREADSKLQALLLQDNFHGSLTFDEWTPPGNTSTIAGCTLHYLRRNLITGKWSMHEMPLSVNAFDTVGRT